MKHTCSLQKNRDFQHVYKKGKSSGSKYLVVIVLKNNRGLNRLGISASKKVGHAVQRNRTRRRLKEAYRLLEQHVRSGHDIVILPRAGSADAAYATLASQLKHLLHKQGMLQSQ